MPFDPASRATATALLEAVHTSGSDAMDQLLPLIYDELREMAHRRLLRERPGHTLGTTALVHEAYLRLVDQSEVTAQGRAYFFGAAAQAMRRVLIEHARKRKTEKRGGGQAALSLDENHVALNTFAADLLDLDDALDRLAALNPRQARVVECRFFGGLTIEETAAVLDVSSRTVRYDWTLARAWLYHTLRGDDA